MEYDLTRDLIESGIAAFIYFLIAPVSETTNYRDLGKFGLVTPHEKARIHLPVSHILVQHT